MHLRTATMAPSSPTSSNTAPSTLAPSSPIMCGLPSCMLQQHGCQAIQLHTHHMPAAALTGTLPFLWAISSYYTPAHTSPAPGSLLLSGPPLPLRAPTSPQTHTPQQAARNQDPPPPAVHTITAATAPLTLPPPPT